MRTLRLMVCAAALGAFCAVAPAALALDMLTISDTGSGSPTHWPAYIGMAKGFFAKRGVAVEYIPTPSSAASTQQLAAGSVNMSSSGMADALRGIDKGAGAALFMIECGPAPYEIVAKPSIKSYADLKKKTIMIGGIRDITRIYLDRMIGPAGVKPGDYDLVYAGASSARYAALASGSIDATIITSPFNFKAKADGFSDLGSAEIDDFPFAGYLVNREWAKTHKQQIAAFAAGFDEGAGWFYDASHREEAVDIMIKALPTTQRDDAEKTYDYYTKLKLFVRGGEVRKPGVETLLKILKAQGDIEGSTDPDRFVDTTLIAK